MTDWLKDNFQCVVVPIIIMVTLGMMTLLITTYTHDVAAQASVRNAPVLTNIFTMDGCEPCERLKRRIAAQGIVTRTVITKQPPQVSDGFPACVYVDRGRVIWDNGERIRAHDYRTTGTVTLVHWSRK